MYQIPGDKTLQGPDPENKPLDMIVEQARQGDGTAFAALFTIFNGPICTYLARMVGNDELGRDLAQETFLQAWKGLLNLHGDLHFRAWLYRIATNVAYSHLRRANLIHWLPWTKNDEETGYTEPNVIGPESWIGEIEQVQQVLARLTPQYKACLLLQLVAGFSQREIAAMLGINEKTVGANVCRGREQFRQIYRQMEGDEK